MREVLSSINKKFFVKLGDYNFSPLMELNAGIVLSYCDNLSSNKCNKVPLTICFPQKKGAAIWTSIITLTNFFLEDHINNVVGGINFKIEDKVKIFDSIAEVERVTQDKIFLKFKDQGGIPINKKLRVRLSKVGSNRSLSLKKKFSKDYFKFRNNRNAISKILIPNDPEIINQNNLDSKVLLIAGRGNVKAFHDILNNTEVYEEKLIKTFGIGKNLIIKSDLKPYNDFFKKEIKLKVEKFKSMLTIFCELHTNNSNIKKKVSMFLDRLNNVDSISADFEKDFISFIEDYEGEHEEKLKFILDKFPGAQETLPQKLKAVVLNDISQINEYPETIKGFLALKIPVVIVSNRNVESVSDIEFYNNLFNNNPDYYRINWNRKKIKTLIECYSTSKYIDQELWEQSKRYARQQINIIVTKADKLDNLITQLNKTIKGLDEFELLQKAFYKYFYPALYALKNSNKKTSEISSLIDEFKITFNSAKANGLSASSVDIFNKSIEAANNFEHNSKKYNPALNVFVNSFISLNSSELQIPVDIKKNNLSSPINSDIIFTGYPYREYSGKYLLKSVCIDFIPKIEILCWPNEGNLTYNYLKRRLEAGYFTDNIHKEFNFPAKYLLKSNNEFVEEVESFLKIDSIVQDEVEQEKNLAYLHTFKYKGFGAIESDNSIFKVKCNTINFRDDSFMFLPKNSTILAETEYNGINIKVANLKFNQLSTGIRIFKYQKDRSLYRDIAKKNFELKNAYDNLEIWRLKLGDIFDSCSQCVNETFELLKRGQIKFGLHYAKLTKGNLRNWLFDDEMIMPDHANVQLILSTAFDSKEGIEDKVNILQKDYKKIKAHRIQLAHKIKKIISQQFVNTNDIMDGEIEIDLDGYKVSIDVKTIESLDQSDFEVEYRHTRKLLC